MFKHLRRFDFHLPRLVVLALVAAALLPLLQAASTPGHAASGGARATGPGLIALPNSPNAVPNGIPNGVPSDIPNAVPNDIRNVVPYAVPNSVPNAVSNAIPYQSPLDVAVRTLDPRVIETSGKITVRARYHFVTATTKRDVHFFLLVENSQEMDRSGWGGRRLLERVRDGLGLFVDQQAWGEGAQGGLILFNRDHSVSLGLGGEGQGKQTLKARINNFAVGVGNSAEGVGEAVTEAAELLGKAEAADKALPAIVIVQAGAKLPDSLADIERACQEAKDKGIIIATLTLEGVEQSLASCASPTWTQNSGRPDGDGVPDVLEQLGKSLSSGHQIVRSEYCDRINDAAFKYMTGSGTPRERDSVALDEYCWIEDTPPPAEGFEVSYQIRAEPGVRNRIVDPSLGAVVRLTYGDSQVREFALPAPDVCVHLVGDDQFCETFIRRLTPTAAPSPRPSHTPTLEGPTAPPATTVAPTDVPTVGPTGSPSEPATAVPSETPTGVPASPTAEETGTGPSFAIYLPHASDKAAIGSP